MNKNIAIILGAGKGSRMKLGYNKQFLELRDEPIIVRNIRTFENHCEINGIYIVSSKEEIDKFNKLIEKYNFKKVRGIIEGGKERADSVLNGLRGIEQCNIVLIHDGARPFVSENIISEGIKYAKKYRAAAPGVKVKDTIKQINEDGFSIGTVDREVLISIQTPQCFQYEDILKAHEFAKKNDIILTDDTSAIETLGIHSYIYSGDYNNIKITTAEDIAIAEKILEN
ncbi:2-C-methyl-D-erythritol 4-phosphate cytidylyltransferase [Clostridium bornimense]|uniref:2-C-methyl-D-erythritol 4-phosphate cytidylyltransferase n=1 Tax=Clostridium bornimense TaxID=1216932 RepID=W6RY70_9CLOT|nr:2-C-methyl-D-erythritol 4-phosphate cytidylyltransferase [Clostridium bornimense]CDM69611.1 2-C-methyl-D-erythritol 4-phosphate cytidylyltransferase [Clostridium bornimense]